MSFQAVWTLVGRTETIVASVAMCLVSLCDKQNLKPRQGSKYQSCFSQERKTSSRIKFCVQWYLRRTYSHEIVMYDIKYVEFGKHVGFNRKYLTTSHYIWWRLLDFPQKRMAMAMACISMSSDSFLPCGVSISAMRKSPNMTRPEGGFHQETTVEAKLPAATG